MFTVRALKIKAARADDPAALFLGGAVPIQGINRTVCFYRIIGIDCLDNEYINRIIEMDKSAQKLPSPYVRINFLAAPQPGDVQRLKELSRVWIKALHAEPDDIMKLFLPFDGIDRTVEWTAKKVFCQVLNIFKSAAPVTETVFENFAAKMLYWIERYVKPLFQGGYYPKIVFTGEARKHESLFLFYCANIGCDVLYLHPALDFPSQYPEVLSFSCLREIGSRRHCAAAMPEYVNTSLRQAQTGQQIQTAQLTQPILPILPIHESKQAPGKVQDTERTYEELAMLTTSVVMIGVFDNEKNCMKTGSGVVLNEAGLVLTNWHVVYGGAYYAVRYENDENDYLTETIIKYHTDQDLAIIRVERRTQPIYLAQEKTLARGQKVMAIGSPLGLFNTVSDGIISGFRQINGTDMIQFTAPTSGGSSGGALIDMQGRLIGLIQGGFDAGQNLNLAVDYRVITNFVRQFI